MFAINLVNFSSTKVDCNVIAIGSIRNLDIGGFQLVDLIITELKDHMTCYKFESSHWWKIYS